MASNSQREVFGTTELLESILLHLDLKTLLVSAQLVERRWRNLIRHSAVLQQALFIKGIIPRPTSDEKALRRALGNDSDRPSCQSQSNIATSQSLEMNPLLQEKFGLFFYNAHRDAESTRPMGWGSARRMAYLRDRKRTQACGLMAKHFPDLSLAASEAARAAFMRPEASWRNMLVAQPPMRDIGFSEERSGMGGVGYRFAELRLSDDENGGEEGRGGLRMGELYDAAASWVMGPHPSFSILWNPSEFRWPTTSTDTTRRTRQVNQDEKSALAGRVDVLVTLRHSSSCVRPNKAAKEQIERDRDDFRERFVHPGAARRESSLQGTKSMRWKKHRMDGTEVWEEFGWVEY